MSSWLNWMELRSNAQLDGTRITSYLEIERLWTDRVFGIQPPLGINGTPKLPIPPRGHQPSSRA